MAYDFVFARGSVLLSEACAHSLANLLNDPNKRWDTPSLLSAINGWLDENVHTENDDHERHARALLNEQINAACGPNPDGPDIQALLAQLPDWITDLGFQPTSKMLKTLVPGTNYGTDEIAIPDHFLDPYVGKLYLTAGGKLSNSSEVIAMGLERLVSPEAMLALMLADEEHFCLILGALTEKQRATP